MQYKTPLLGAAALALSLAFAPAAQAQKNRLEANAYKRCEAHQQHDAMCRARVRGGADVRITGSVRGGGLLRENLLAPHAMPSAAGKPVLMTWDRKANLTTYERVPSAHQPWRDPARWYY
ncbi:MAG: hypothetical protein Q4A98_07750 [Comamonadaceae bacterium]|nr:hypothetical protein [Comamonadaceae bacterium]